MRRELTTTGRTVEEAINAACQQLGVDRDDIEFEIIDLPKKGFLGLKNTPAKVSVWKEEPDAPAPAPAVQKQQPAPAEPKPVRQPAPAPVQDKPVQTRQPAEQKNIELTGDVAKKAEIAVAYLEGVCKQMGLTATFATSVADGGLLIQVEGEGLGAMIGRRGETLDALQYLTGLVANRLEGDYLRLTVDCGGYRSKRKVTLEALAQKLSAQVLKTNTSKTLEPMNPFERRIIHATVSEIEGVSSTSVGEEPNRRVIITSPTARPPRRDGARSGGPRRDDRGPRRDDRGGNRNSSGGNRGRRGGPPPRRDNRTNQGGAINTVANAFPVQSQPQAQQPVQQPKPAETPKSTPEATTDKPLYAKLDLE